MICKYHLLLVALMLLAQTSKAESNCTKFSGIWTRQAGVLIPSLPPIEIDSECKAIKRDVPIYSSWTKLKIDKSYTAYSFGDNPTDVRQFVRGAWNADKSRLVIEQINLVEQDQQYPAGRSLLRTEIWSLEENGDVLVVESRYLSMNPADFSSGDGHKIEKFYRYP